MFLADAIYRSGEALENYRGLLMEQCGQCVGQEKIREPFLMDKKEYIP